MNLTELTINHSNQSKQKCFGLIPLLCLFFSLTNFSVFAGEKIKKSVLADDISKVKIYNDRGSINVRTWDKNEILVKGEIDDLADNFIFEKKENSILLEVKLTAKHAHGKNNGKGSKLEVWLPKNYELEFNGIATDININGLDGDININSVSGNVVAKSIKGNLKIKNISGKTELNDIHGNIDVSIVSGDLVANVMSRKIKVKGISSDISVKVNEIDEVSLFSVSGETKLSGELKEHANINLENISGKSFFFFKQTVDAKVLIETGPDGSIINRIKPHEKTESHLNSQQQHFVNGLGNAKITIKTVSGVVGLKDYKEWMKRKKR